MNNLKVRTIVSLELKNRNKKKNLANESEEIKNTIASQTDVGNILKNWKRKSN